MREHEKLIVERTLQANGRDRDVAAMALGVTRRGLEKIMERHGLLRPVMTKPLPIPYEE